MSVHQTPIAVESLPKAYDGRTVLDGVDLTVGRGEIVGLLGPNGAGKTTLLETLAGLRRPTGGTARVFGVDPFRDRARVTRLLAVQPQSAALFPTLTVEETLTLFAALHDEPLPVADVLERLDLTGSRRIRVKNLSGGQERRLLIGVALIGRPRVVVLDEPSAGLDPLARQTLWRVIRDLAAGDVAILLSTHDMTEATELCDRVVILVRGTIAASGTPDELVRLGRQHTTVSFTVAPSVTAEHVRGLLGADVELRSRVDGHLVTTRTADPDEVIRRLTFTPELQARSFHVSPGTLEHFFTTTVGERVREPRP